MAMMKAVRMHAFGGPEVLVYEDAPQPQAGPDEVLMQIHAAGVNPSDWKLREGQFGTQFKLPIIPGFDAVGVIQAVGGNVQDFRPGDAVVAYLSPFHSGSYAEYAVAKPVRFALKPDSLDMVTAAALPTAAMIAWEALFDVAGLSAGQTVLIHAAAGGVGAFATQLAKWKGAHVIGTASQAHLAFIQQQGADEAIDYRATPFETVTHDVDVVLDTIGGQTQERSWQVLKPGGFLVSLVQAPAEASAAAHQARGQMATLKVKPGLLTEISKLADEGILRPHVQTVLPLSEAHQAQAQSQAGHALGKIALQVATG